MSKKKHAPHPSKPMRKMTGGKVAREHDAVSASFRHCRPKRDWSGDAPAPDGKSIKEVSAR